MKKSPLKSWQYFDNPFSSYSMISDNLLKSKQFQSLTNAEKNMLFIIIVHANTSECVTCLYNTLGDYEEKNNIDIPDIDLSDKVGTRARKKQFGSPYFVIPKRQLEQYGIKPPQATRYISALIERGFITKYAYDKGHYLQTSDSHSDFNRLPTVYRFSDKWKKT